MARAVLHTLGMRKVDFYAIQQPWRMPRWLGGLIGGGFAIIAIGAAVAIIQLTTPPKAPEPVAAALAPQDTPAAPVQAQAQAASRPIAALATKHGDDDAKPIVRKATKRTKKHAKAARRAKKGKAARTAVAKRSTGMTDNKAAAILAKHEGKAQRKERDALDKLLGL